MIPLVSDDRFNSIALIVIAMVTVIGSIITARLAQSAKNTAVEARDNAQDAKDNSHAAKVSAAEAAHEVKTNGGMSDPNPNLNDHVKYQTEMMEGVLKIVGGMQSTVGIIGDTLVDVDTRLTDHLEHSTGLEARLNAVENKEPQ